MKRQLLDRLLDARAEKRAAAMVTDLSDGQQCLFIDSKVVGDIGLTDAQADRVARAIAADRSGMIDDSRLFVRVFNTPLRLFVIGAVHITQALAPMAELAGYAVTVIDPRQAWATDARFPGVRTDGRWPDEALTAAALDHRSAVVTLTHDPKLDDPALNVALNSDCFYIGSLGSRRTHGARLTRLKEAGFDDQILKRIHGPVGLDIGAKSPSEIAVSILAQITETRHRRPDADQPKRSEAAA